MYLFVIHSEPDKSKPIGPCHRGSILSFWYFCYCSSLWLNSFLSAFLRASSSQESTDCMTTALRVSLCPPSQQVCVCSQVRTPWPQHCSVPGWSSLSSSSSPSYNRQVSVPALLFPNSLRVCAPRVATLACI